MVDSRTKGSFDQMVAGIPEIMDDSLYKIDRSVYFVFTLLECSLYTKTIPSARYMEKVRTHSAQLVPLNEHY
jgi:hypothetical protein